MRYVETANCAINESNDRSAQLQSLKFIADAKLLYLYPHVYYSRAQETTP